MRDSSPEYSTAPQAGAPVPDQSWPIKDGTPIKLPAITPKLSATPGATKWLGPDLGEHNNEVLRGRNAVR